MEKTWKNESRHTTFESADERRNALLAQNVPGMLVKVKLMNSDDTFVVKTHKPPEEKRPKNKPQEKGKPKTRAQRRAQREKRKKERES